MSDERIEINCAVPGHWVDEVLGGVHDGGLPEDPRTPCLSAAEMDEMMDDGVTGYVPIASLQHWAREAAQARAENERLREACFEASLRLHGSLARHRDLDLDLVSYQYVTSASSLLNVALDHSGTLDDQTERWLERAKADAQPGPKHAATDLMAELEASIARVRADRAGRAAPSPSTGEDGGK